MELSDILGLGIFFLIVIGITLISWELSGGLARYYKFDKLLKQFPGFVPIEKSEHALIAKDIKHFIRVNNTTLVYRGKIDQVSLIIAVTGQEYLSKRNKDAPILLLLPPLDHSKPFSIDTPGSTLFGLIKHKWPTPMRDSTNSGWIFEKVDETEWKSGKFGSAKFDAAAKKFVELGWERILNTQGWFVLRKSPMKYSAVPVYSQIESSVAAYSSIRDM